MRILTYALITPLAIALLAAGLGPTTRSQGHLDDATIVAIFDLANTADIETGRLAESLGKSPEVREMGKNFATAHTQVRQQGRDLAKQLGMIPTPPKDGSMAKAHAEALARLQTLSGAAFDRAFLDHEVTYHQAVIDAVTNTLLPAIKNADLRRLVTSVAPAFVAHLEGAKALRARLAL